LCPNSGFRALQPCGGKKPLRRLLPTAIDSASVLCWWSFSSWLLLRIPSPSIQMKNTQSLAVQPWSPKSFLQTPLPSPGEHCFRKAPRVMLICSLPLWGPSAHSCPGEVPERICPSGLPPQAARADPREREQGQVHRGLCAGKDKLQGGHLHALLHIAPFCPGEGTEAWESPLPLHCLLPVL